MAGDCVDLPLLGPTGSCCSSKCNGQESLIFKGTFYGCQAFWAAKSACLHCPIKTVMATMWDRIFRLCARVRIPCIDFSGGGCTYIVHVAMPFFTCSCCNFITCFSFADTAFSPRACVRKSYKPACFPCPRCSSTYFYIWVLFTYIYYIYFLFAFVFTCIYIYVYVYACKFTWIYNNIYIYIYIFFNVYIYI